MEYGERLNTEQTPKRRRNTSSATDLDTWTKPVIPFPQSAKPSHCVVLRPMNADAPLLGIQTKSDCSRFYAFQLQVLYNIHIQSYLIQPLGPAQVPLTID
jgi:hypothetical protein